MPTIQEKRIAGFIEPVLTNLGYDLVSLRIIGSQKLQTLQIMAENPDTGTLDLDGCTEISHAVSALLDVEDPIQSAYQLEVSSPGIDRPLVKDRDFVKYIGYEISVETIDANQDGARKFRGRLSSFDGESFTIITDHGDEPIRMDNLVRAKLILTDELAKQALKNSKNKNKNKETEE
ncbi:MAG TPA: ribosome maturation factor RimP [Rhodospirillaceae bacterium]|nr:ribosome maturation factor RimP [Rhodospirillaceae bacterium]